MVLRKQRWILWRLVAVLVAFGLALLSGTSQIPVVAGGAILLQGDLYYTKFNGSPRVKKVSFTYDGSVFTLGSPQAVANPAGADGILFGGDGDLLVGGQGDRIYKINPTTGSTVWKTAGGTASYHLALDPSAQKLWSAGIPGALAEVPLNPFANGIHRALNGDDTSVTSLAFDSAGQGYYTRSGAGGFGSVGKINMATFTTTRYLTNIAAAHGMAYDQYTGHLLLFGSNHVTQIDPATMTVVADKAFSGMEFDQGTVDGRGHMFVASNNGRLFFMDYADSGLINAPTNFVYTQFLDSYLDDVAPLTGPGAQVDEILLEIAGGGSHPIGDLATITARAVDIGGNGMAGIPITVTVTGVHPATFTGTTGPDGRVSFTYTGTVVGDDMALGTGGGATSNPLLVHWTAGCAADPTLSWKAPLSDSAAYNMPVGSTADLRFAYGTCAGFLHDESVIMMIQDVAHPETVVTVWVYGSDIVIDDASAEYRQSFSPSSLFLHAGQQLKVIIFIGDEYRGEAMINLVP